MPPFLLANLGGEEHWSTRRSPLKQAQLSTVALWRSLFSAEAKLLDHRIRSSNLSPAIPCEGPAWPFLCDRRALCPWIVTEGALRRSEELDAPLHGPPCEVVRAVHDKAFAVQLAAELFPEYAAVHWSRILQPEALNGDLWRSVLEHLRQDCPAEAADRFTLKPRWGSSGRGRAPGLLSRWDAPELLGAFRRFARLGGAILEPWLDRSADYSAQFHVSETGEIQCLGSLEQIMSVPGVCLGHRGIVGAKGKITAGSDWDNALEQTSRRIVNEAATRGFWGVCGVDAFTYRNTIGIDCFRPAVELNARFTLGSIAIGLLRRLDLLGIEQGAFAFIYSPRRLGKVADQSVRVIDLLKDAPLSPVLLLARGPAELDALIRDLTRSDDGETPIE